MAMTIKEKSKKFYIRHREELINKARERRKKLPWETVYHNAVNHCRREYYKRGIKCHMVISDFKNLWFRDKAYEMIRPSIDRIDPAGHYEINNCRFIELIDNQKRPKFPLIRRWDLHIRCIKCSRNDIRYYAKEKCKKCYMKEFRVLAKKDMK